MVVSEMTLAMRTSYRFTRVHTFVGEARLQGGETERLLWPGDTIGEHETNKVQNKMRDAKTKPTREP